MTASPTKKPDNHSIAQTDVMMVSSSAAPMRVSVTAKEAEEIIDYTHRVPRAIWMLGLATAVGAILSRFWHLPPSVMVPICLSVTLVGNAAMWSGYFPRRRLRDELVRRGVDAGEAADIARAVLGHRWRQLNPRPQQRQQTARALLARLGSTLGAVPPAERDAEKDLVDFATQLEDAIKKRG